jgi:hypothetical protein
VDENNKLGNEGTAEQLWRLLSAISWITVVEVELQAAEVRRDEQPRT